MTFVLPGRFTYPSGGPKVVYQYANMLVKRGHTVNVVHPLYMRNVKKTIRRVLIGIKSIFVRSKTRSWITIDPKVNMLYVFEPLPKYLPDADAVFATAWETAEYVRDYP